jgi:PKD repeat protein
MVHAALAAVTLAVAAGSAPVLAQPGPPDRSTINLPEHRNRGQAAIDALGTRLPEVARWYGMTPTHLQHLFRTDPTLHADKGGRLFHIEHTPFAQPPGAGKRGPQGSTTATVAATDGTLPYPADQTFKLHSRPGATRTIYLDFNGHVATGTAWNASYGLTTITNRAFSLDADPNTFTVDEHAAIQRAWQRVAEDFAMFDVDVTTEEPPADRLERSGSTDTAYGIRAVITTDFTKATSTPCGCGGFSYIGVVGRTYYSPSYVFYDNLASNERYIAEAISHEVGHALGLSHDGTSTQNYYAGHGSGVDSWAPIMGVGYYANVTQWSKGDYPGANNLEDDIAIIAQSFPLRRDDVADTYAQATSLGSVTAGTMQTLSASGVIDTAADVDVFTYYAGVGAQSFTVTGAPRGQNTDLLVEIRDGAGAILATARPADSLGATVSWTAAAAGRFYLVVTSTGAQDGSNSFAEYGSMGQYVIAGTAPAVAGLVAPVAVASSSAASGTAPFAVTFSSTGSYDPDGTTLAYQWDFGDGSAPVASAAPTYTYANAGTYTATLRVTDASGLSSVATVPITVTSTTVTPSVLVGGITLSVKKQRRGTDVTATVTVRDANGAVVPNATVTGGWSGAVTGTSSGTTSSTGVVSMRASRTTAASGTATFTVQALSASGFAYAPAKNVESVDTISW